MQFQAPVHGRRLVAHAADDQVHPFVRGELGPQAAILLDVEGGDLNRRQGVDPEGMFALVLLVVVEADVHLGPDAAHEQPVVVAHVVGRHMDEAVRRN